MIAGTIADQNSGELLAGVEVHLEGTGQKTYTDFDGNFIFKVRPGEYTLVTNYISYEKKAEKLAVNQKDNNVKIQLKNAIEL